jgi:hypothetical protein
VDEPGDIEQRLAAIREANAFDLTIPEHRTSLQEAARRAGATSEEIRKAADENENWPV